MSTIKDIIDLTTQLSKSVKDRKFAAEISQIQSLISTVQLENASLMSENLELQKKIFELEKNISNLKDRHSKEIDKLKRKPIASIKVI